MLLFYFENYSIFSQTLKDYNLNKLIIITKLIDEILCTVALIQYFPSFRSNLSSFKTKSWLVELVP